MREQQSEYVFFPQHPLYFYQGLPLYDDITLNHHFFLTMTSQLTYFILNSFFDIVNIYTFFNTTEYDKRRFHGIGNIKQYLFLFHT